MSLVRIFRVTSARKIKYKACYENTHFSGQLEDEPFF